MTKSKSPSKKITKVVVEEFDEVAYSNNKKKKDIIDSSEEEEEEEEEEDINYKQSRNKSKNQIQPEAIFFKRKGSKYPGQQLGEYADSHCVKITTDKYRQQSIDYTNQQLENLSREIRRHPNIALKSYHFLNRGLSTKVTHQIIRIILSALLLCSLLLIVYKLPLPELHNITLSPKTPNISLSDDLDSSAIYKNQLHSTKISEFKESWSKFSIIGISNYLCCDYNFNPFDDLTVDNHRKTPSSNDQGKIHYNEREQDLKNIRIFGSTVAFGIIYFGLWLFASRLAEKEIIMDSTKPLQILHSITTLYLIPLVSMIFWSLVALYFIQTLLIGPGHVQEDIFHCISKLSSGLLELISFSPLRELILGAVGITMRILYNYFGFPISSLSLHSNSTHLSDNQLKLISFSWALLLGSIIYHFGMIISYLYSIFRERTVKLPPSPQPISSNSPSSQSPSTSPQQSNQASGSSSASSTPSSANNNNTSDQSSTSLMTLDLKFLPSFIPEVLLTQNFIIVFIWTLVSCFLWAFGSPIPNSHEGEIFYIFLTSSGLIQSIYQLIVILQKRETIEKLHQDSAKEFLHDNQDETD